MRPKGWFDLNKNALLEHLKANRVYQTNEILSKELRVSSGSITKYLRALKKEGKVSVSIRKLYDASKHKFYSLREINVLEN